MIKGQKRFVGVALSAMLALSYFLIPSLRPAPTPIPVVHATGNWTGGSAPGSGQAPWETFAGDVNIANGNLMLAGSGPRIPGVNSFDEVISPTYNSLSSTRATDMGNGWIMGTGRDVGLDLSVAGQVTFYDPTGHGYTFTVPSSCSFTPPAGIDAQLACSGGGYTLTFNRTSLQYQFDSGGNLTALQNRQGNQIQFAYNTSGLLTQITNTEGQVTTVSYDASNRVSQITTPGSPALTWTYSYDASSNLTKITDAASNAVTYGYDASSRLTKITSAAGNVTNISYDSNGRVSQIVRVTNPATQTGPTWTFAYNSGSTQVTDPNNHTSTYVFDSSNRVTSVTDAENHTSQTSWTADNQVAQQIAPSGATTTFTFDTSNRPEQDPGLQRPEPSVPADLGDGRAGQHHHHPVQQPGPPHQHHRCPQPHHDHRI